ncbi:hypothetical protein AJ79_06173 [Helicocarpus griseus UAMH5409]|uniref:Major facilitator superfamily (MFS) profile domain-containing protein n=1 Tax=Helicocarpus griseus UAMH5409 TaxID=1447875 RepID=A0A2B7XFP7_9EURO|nr:hypothetical protein AJ79_06173 [Helicocarpus griseus UAMH5409]
MASPAKENGVPPTLKKDGQLAEQFDIEPQATHDELGPTLAKEHSDYLLIRHGTLDLAPIPSASDADPYNWPTWKKIANLVLVAFHACMSTFTAAAIIPAYGHIAEEFHITIPKASYLTSLQIAILGGAPLFWKPLSSRFGRRPIFLLSLICSLVGNVGCAKSPSYGTMGLCRAITAFFISPAIAIGSAVVTETFFTKERARYMGMWTMMITLGIPVAALLFGFVAHRVGYRWIYWVLAIANGVQFILYLFLGPETLYLRTNPGPQDSTSTFKREYISFRRIDPKPFSVRDFLGPLKLAKYPSVTIPACAYSMIFLFGSVMASVEVPTLFIPKFDFNPEQLGLQFLGLIIGSIIGEQLGGALSDYWMNRRARQKGARPDPEYRLWLSYFGYVLAIVGVIVFLVRTEQAPQHKWNVTPIIGVGIAACGNQLVTTVLITYAVDCCQEQSANVGVYITLVRQIWGFIGPFWFPAMFEDVGIAASSGVTSALMVGVAVIPTILLQWQGAKWRPQPG